MTHTNRRLAWRLYRLGWIDAPDPAKATRVVEAVRQGLAKLVKVFSDFVRAVRRGLEQIAGWLAPFMVPDGASWRPVSAATSPMCAT